MEHSDGELYDPTLIGLLELVWGDGFLSPGGPDEVARVLEGIGLEGRSVLDIGCGVGGIDVLLVERFGAGYVTGVDVEDTVLAGARARVERAGFAVVNLDITVICERPKLSPRKAEMTANIARLLGLEAARVNLKGKTHEKVDAVGEGRAVEVHVVSLLARVR
jgi:SAM-dependent methyltransferase